MDSVKIESISMAISKSIQKFLFTTNFWGCFLSLNFSVRTAPTEFYQQVCQIRRAYRENCIQKNRYGFFFSTLTPTSILEEEVNSTNYLKFTFHFVSFKRFGHFLPHFDNFQLFCRLSSFHKSV